MNITHALFRGDSLEAEAKFPFLQRGKYAKVINTDTRKIGVFPNENSFYVVTYQPMGRSKYQAIVEETNCIGGLERVIERETCGEQYLDAAGLSKVKNFLKENGCGNILY